MGGVSTDHFSVPPKEPWLLNHLWGKTTCEPAKVNAVVKILGKKRHHFALFVRNCKLVMLLRREYQEGEENVFKPAEWRWRMPQVKKFSWAVALAQLVERPFTTPQIRGPNPIIWSFNYYQMYWINSIEKTRIDKKRPIMPHLKILYH